MDTASSQARGPSGDRQLTLALLQDVDGAHVEVDAVVALDVLEEERLVVVAVDLDGDAGPVAGHRRLVDVGDGVAAFLKAEPCPADHVGHGALAGGSWGEGEGGGG